MFPHVVGEALGPAKGSIGQLRRAVSVSAKSAPRDAPVLIHARPQLQEEGDRLSLLPGPIGIDEAPCIGPNTCQLSLFLPIFFLPLCHLVLLFRQYGRREISTPVANEERSNHGYTLPGNATSTRRTGIAQSKPNSAVSCCPESPSLPGRGRLGSLTPPAGPSSSSGPSRPEVARRMARSRRSVTVLSASSPNASIAFWIASASSASPTGSSCSTTITLLAFRLQSPTIDQVVPSPTPGERGHPFCHTELMI